MSDGMRDLLQEAAQRIFADRPSDLWGVLHSAGFDKALLPESEGGAGVRWSDAFGLLASAGEHAAAVPLAEAMIGHWLADRAGVGSPGLPTVAMSSSSEPVRLEPAGERWLVSGSLPRVPWGRACTHVAFVVGEGPTARLIIIDRSAPGVSVTPGHNLAGEARDHVVLEGVEPVAMGPAPLDAGALLVIGAIARSAMMAGAIEHILALAVDYANLRVQFGRQIGKFQAIQQNIAVLATLAAAARAAADAGSEAIDDWLAGHSESLTHSIEALSAKIRTGEAAGQASAIVHQVFGAIGFTEEHELHNFTKRLWSWRDECGNEAFWSLALGEHILDCGTDETLWRSIAPAQNGIDTIATGAAR